MLKRLWKKIKKLFRRRPSEHDLVRLSNEDYTKCVKHIHGDDAPIKSIDSTLPEHTHQQKQVLLEELDLAMSIDVITTSDIFKYVDVNDSVVEEAFYQYMQQFKVPIVTEHGREKCPDCGRYITKNVSTQCTGCGQRIFRNTK